MYATILDRITFQVKDLITAESPGFKQRVNQKCRRMISCYAGLMPAQ